MSRDKDATVDIINAIEEIMLSMDGVSFTQLAANREKQAAILYFLIVIGEATKRLSKGFRASHPEIDWGGMAGMRDILTHQYDRVDIQVVWDVAQTDLPPLLESLRALLTKIP
ncbi:MAG: DUF86 domain-containing protein [Leptolyngbyaceae cyanobacterium RM2_2_4]|jgi:uncharacterized protein with HEPN domain|nr:DUF86 domain-containing protein [Leptolyngbyaceae cyanobacterium SM1_4_3]NJN90852.1 DUF86 domain-containing protein [Leptolyngbyaceae cyanobacterium SL_5_14]NJO51385.1 DUF86 domain-containing protein [Leptolyngbyaceae cyanobacterium RM2_2_4]NJO66441.1 DUF86 domain-containing protein [Leptolyngbyaceae cyanobacterium RM1_405_57]